jgi:hypothetical protein
LSTILCVCLSIYLYYFLPQQYSGQAMKLIIYLNLGPMLSIGAILKRRTGTHLWITSNFCIPCSFSSCRASSGVPFNATRRSSNLLHIFISEIESPWE